MQLNIKAKQNGGTNIFIFHLWGVSFHLIICSIWFSNLTERIGERVSKIIVCFERSIFNLLVKQYVNWE